MKNSCFCVTIIAVWLQLQQLSAAEDYVPNVPEECKSLGYCEQAVPDYPEEHIESLITELGLENAHPTVVDATKPTRRQDPQEVALCEGVGRTIIPKVAQDTNGQWSFIINSPSRFQQAFLVEICKNVDSPCSSVANFNTGYTASCQQNFISKLMVALNEKGEKVEKTFRLPSNCYCQVKQS